MRLIIFSVGRWKRGPERDLFERYVHRCPWPIALVELALKKPVSAHETRQAESRLVLDHLDPRWPVVLLDEGGRMETSEAFAARLGRLRDAGHGGASFVIGGADGVDDALRTRATATLAFGRMTWPHLLVRVLLAEQLYRASTILAGHPYHRSTP